jgi:hypothetical protein
MQQDFAPFGEVMHKITSARSKRTTKSTCALPGRHGQGEGSRSTSSSRRFLRSDRDRRMPPRQRRR